MEAFGKNLKIFLTLGLALLAGSVYYACGNEGYNVDTRWQYRWKIGVTDALQVNLQSLTVQCENTGRQFCGSGAVSVEENGDVFCVMSCCPDDLENFGTPEETPSYEFLCIEFD